MSASTLSLIFQSASGLALLFVLSFIWSAQRVDIFRQRMFAIRDELFDFAEAGGIDFGDPAYDLLRNSMNGFIRYAHRLSFFQVMITIARWNLTEQVHPLTWHQKWKEALASLPEDVQRRLVDFHGRAMDAVARQLIGGSVVLVVLLLGSAAQLLIRGAWTSIRMVFRDASERAVKSVLDPRMLEEEAVRA